MVVGILGGGGGWPGAETPVAAKLRLSLNFGCSIGSANCEFARFFSVVLQLSCSGRHQFWQDVCVVCQEAMPVGQWAGDGSDQRGACFLFCQARRPKPCPAGTSSTTSASCPGPLPQGKLPKFCLAAENSFGQGSQ